MTVMAASHIHTPDDGPGRRRVLVDGKVVERVIYADIVAGEVCYHPQPLKVENGRVATATVRGKVEVLQL